MTLSTIAKHCYAECRVLFIIINYYAECRYTKCRNAECRNAECRYAECRYDVCCYAQCRGAVFDNTSSTMFHSCLVFEMNVFI